MLKLTLKFGDYIDIGENIRVVSSFFGGSANNIHLLVDAPREMILRVVLQKEKATAFTTIRNRAFRNRHERDCCNSDEGAPQQIRRSKVIRSG